jgi:hypothetical protein
LADFNDSAELSWSSSASGTIASMRGQSVSRYQATQSCLVWFFSVAAFSLRPPDTDFRYGYLQMTPERGYEVDQLPLAATSVECAGRSAPCQPAPPHLPPRRREDMTRCLAWPASQAVRGAEAFCGDVEGWQAFTGPRSPQVGWRSAACTLSMSLPRHRREDEDKHRILAAPSLEPHGVLGHGNTSRSARSRGNNTRSRSCRVRALHRRSS